MPPFVRVQNGSLAKEKHKKSNMSDRTQVQNTMQVEMNEETDQLKEEKAPMAEVQMETGESAAQKEEEIPATPHSSKKKNRRKKSGFRSTLQQELRQKKALNESLTLEAANALAAHEARMAEDEEAHRRRYRDLELKLTAALRLEMDAVSSKHERQVAFLEEKMQELSSANQALLRQQQALEEEIASNSGKIRLLQGEIKEAE